jgi:hypothetical protein
MDKEHKRIVELMRVHRRLQQGIKRMKSCECPRNHAFFISEMNLMKEELEQELLFFIPEAYKF